MEAACFGDFVIAWLGTKKGSLMQLPQHLFDKLRDFDAMFPLSRRSLKIQFLTKSCKAILLQNQGVSASTGISIVDAVFSDTLIRLPSRKRKR